MSHSVSQCTTPESSLLLPQYPMFMSLEQLNWFPPLSNGLLPSMSHTMDPSVNVDNPSPTLSSMDDGLSGSLASHSLK